MKLTTTAVEFHSSSIIVGFCFFWVVMLSIPMVAYAEGSGELRNSIRNLTQPVIRSVRTVTRPTLKTNSDKAETVKETSEEDSRKKGVSPASYGNQPSDAQ